MKRIIFILLLPLCAIGLYAQAGDLYVGAQGGYITKYEGLLYGLNVSYDISDPLQISFTGLLNPALTEKDGFNSNNDEKLALYSMNLDLRILLLNQKTWATGPAVGGQYLIAKYKNDPAGIKNFETLCFNIGWHIRANVSDNLRVTGGWRYTNTKESIGASHHMFYIGVGYAFNLF
jgi:opacity protein-like surface antigen